MPAPFNPLELPRRWLGLALGSLVLAGLFSIVLVVGRMPPLSDAITDPLFFRRCLVVHVDLALVVWFYAFLGAVFALLPSGRRPSRLTRTSPAVALGGVALLLIAAGVPGAEPVLSNYIPVIDHPLFVAGLLLFALGVALTLLDGRLLLPGSEDGSVSSLVPEAARPLLRGAALAFVLALLTFLASTIVTPSQLAADVYYELVAWGGGHALQFANVAAMTAIWLTLLTGALGRPVMSRKTATVLSIALIGPLLMAPILAGQGTTLAAYRTTFTRLMELGIFPAVTVILALCLRALWKARRAGVPLKSPAVLGFAVSAVLTVVGFVLGAFIHGSNTLVPAHYHASIGAVTAAYMAITWPLLERLGAQLPSGRRLRAAIAWQPVAFGMGQTVFAIGFAFAGAHGMGRKLYGQEQQERTVAESIGLTVMGIGGLVAIAAGLLFIGAAVTVWYRSTRERRGSKWNLRGNREVGASIPFNG